MRLRRIKQRQQQRASRAEVNETTSDPVLHYHIGKSEKLYDEFGAYLRNHAKDPVMKVINILLGHHHSDMRLRTSCLD